MENLRVPGSWVDFLVDAEAEFSGTVYPEFAFKGHGVADISNLKVFNQSYVTATNDNLILQVAPVHGVSDMEFDVKHFAFLASATGVDKEARKALPGQVVDEFYLTSRTPRRQTAALQGGVPAFVVGTEFWGGTLLRFTSTFDAAGTSQTDQSPEWEKRFNRILRGRVVWNRNSQLHSYGDFGADVKYRWEF